MKIGKIAKIGIGAAVTIGCCAATGVATYKAYPKIKACKDANKGFKETVKEVAPTYLPVFGGVVVAVGLVFANEIVGERKVAELETKFKKATEKYSKVSGWYKNQTEAIKEEMKPNDQEKIFAKAKEKDDKDRKDRLEYDYSTVYKIYDPTCGVTFEASRGDLFAISDILNQKLAVDEGLVGYDEFYQLVGEDLPDKYRGWGWSCATAVNQYVKPWIMFGLYGPNKATNPNANYDFELYFEGDRGDGVTCPFDPVEAPEMDEWNMHKY